MSWYTSDWLKATHISALVNKQLVHLTGLLVFSILHLNFVGIRMNTRPFQHVKGQEKVPESAQI